MATQHPNMVDFRNITAGLYAFAVVVTSVRLVVRIGNKKWWWDDTLALVSMLMMSLFVAGSVLLAAVGSSVVAGYYLLVVGYYVTVWAARVSILLTVIRIAPFPRQHRVFIGFLILFAFQWLLLTIQIFWVCEITSTQWKKQVGGLCVVGDAVAITQVITTVISDLTLVMSPLWIIRKVQLDPSLRFRLVSAFFVSIATMVAALVHAVLIIRSPGPWEAIFGGVESCVSLTVCNASVIIPLVARLFSASDTYDDSGVVTIGGTNQKYDATRLNTLHATMPTAVICVEVAIDSEQQSHSGWDQKKRTSLDHESFDQSTTKLGLGLTDV